MVHLRLLLVAVLVLLSVRGPALSQSSPVGSSLITQTFSLSGTGPSPTLALTGGQSVCSVVVENSSAFSGLTLVPQAASDGPARPQTWTTVTTINGGSISTTGAPAPGSIVGFGLTNFRINVTAISSGTVVGVIACNTANGSSGSQVNVSNPTSPADGLGVPLVATGGILSKTCPSNATTVIKSTPGRFAGAIVTTVGSGAGTAAFYDNATTGSGLVIGGFTNAASLIQYSTLLLQPWASNGIVCVSSANGPVLTVFYQ